MAFKAATGKFLRGIFSENMNAALLDLGFSSEEQLGILFLIGYTACRDASHELNRLLETESADTGDQRAAAEG